VFFSYETLSADHKTPAECMLLNPVGAVLQQARHAMLSPAYASAPSPAYASTPDAVGGYGPLLVPTAITIGLFVCGFIYFDRQAPRIAEEL
jgi:hypothetical protein